MLRALDGAYVLRDLRRRQHRGDLPARARRLDPADRHAQAQGREDPHRHRAEGSQEARRVARLSGRARRAHPPLHRQGRRRQVDRRRRHRGARRRARATARWCCPPTPRTRWPTRSAPPVGSRADRGRRAAVRAAGRRAAALRAVVGGHPALPALGARRRRGRPGRRRGADRDPGRRGGARAARAAPARALRRVGRRSSSTARRPPRPCGCSRCPRRSGWYMQRVLPVERRVVKALKPVLSTGPPACRCPRTGLRRGRAAARRARRGARRCSPGPDASVRLVLTPENVVLAEARRVLHDALAVRLPRRRRRRQPGLPGRGRRRLAGRLGDGAGRGARPRSPSRSRGCRSGARSTAPASRSASRRCATRRASCTTAPTRSRAPPGDGPVPDHPRPPPARCCAWRCRSSPGPRSTWPGTATSSW